MQDLNDLFYFVRVVDHGGFAPASRAIDVPKSKLSRRVAGLEERLGVRLLHRSTRRLSLTEIGRHYYERCVAMLVEAEAAEETVERSVAEPRGLVRMSCPPAMLHFVVADLLAGFMARYPQVRVEVEASGRRIDPVREGYDLALRVRFPPLEDTELNHRVLSRSPQRLMAAPALLKQQTRPAVPADLNSLPSLDWTHADGKHSWFLEGPAGASTRIVHNPRLVTDDLDTLYRAALAGTGIVQLPLMIGQPAIADGRLVDVLPQWTPRSGITYVVFPSRRGLLPSVRRLIDYLAAGFAEQDVETTPTADSRTC